MFHDVQCPEATAIYKCNKGHKDLAQWVINSYTCCTLCGKKIYALSPRKTSIHVRTCVVGDFTQCIIYGQNFQQIIQFMLGFKQWKI